MSKISVIFNILVLHPVCVGLSSRPFASDFLAKFLCIFSCIMNATCPAHLSLIDFYYCNNMSIKWRAQIVKLYYCLSLRSKYYRQLSLFSNVVSPCSALENQLCNEDCLGKRFPSAFETRLTLGMPVSKVSACFPHLEVMNKDVVGNPTAVQLFHQVFQDLRGAQYIGTDLSSVVARCPSRDQILRP